MPAYLSRNLLYEGVILSAYFGMYEYSDKDLQKSSEAVVAMMALRLVAISVYNAIYNYSEKEESRKRKVDPIHWFEIAFFLGFALISVLKDNEDFLKLQPAISAAMVGIAILVLPFFTQSPFCKTMFGNLLEKYYPAHKEKIAEINEQEWKHLDYACAGNLLFTAAALLVLGKFCPDDLWIYLKYPVIIGSTLPVAVYSYNVLKPHLAGEVASKSNVRP